MLNGAIFSQPRQYEHPLLDVGLSGEKGEVLVDLPQPGLGLLRPEQALVTTPHRHDYIYWENLNMQKELIERDFI